MPFGSLWVVYQLPGQQGQHGLVGAAGRPANKRMPAPARALTAPPPMPPQMTVFTPWRCK